MLLKGLFYTSYSHENKKNDVWVKVLKKETMKEQVDDWNESITNNKRQNS